MNLRGKEVYIITAVIVVVVCVAWFFLFYNPLRKDVSQLDGQIEETQQQLTTAQTDLARLKGYEKTAPQTRADLLRLNKMLPGQTGVPSIIIELTRTAQESGLDFVSIQPGVVAPGAPFSVQPLTLTFHGQFYDLEDFLFRLESYVEYRNDAFLVTGRLLQVASVSIGEGPDPGFPNLTVDVVVNAYLWSQAQQSTATTGTPPAAQPSATPSSSPSPAEGVVSPSPTDTLVSPSPGGVSPAPSGLSPSPSGGE